MYNRQLWASYFIKVTSYKLQLLGKKVTKLQQIQQICSKLSSGSWAILKSRQYVDLPTLKTVYFSLIYSHLQYCISSWGLAHANAHSPLEKLPVLGTASFFLSPQSANPQPNFNFLSPQPQVRNWTFKSLVRNRKSATTFRDS